MLTASGAAFDVGARAVSQTSPGGCAWLPAEEVRPDARDQRSTNPGAVMNLHRLRPTSLPQAGSRHRGSWAACREPLGYRQQVVSLYGEAFHHECMFYRRHHNSSPHKGRGRPG